MASTNSSTVQIIVVLRALPTSAAVMDEDDLISAMEKKHEFILQGDKYECKSKLIVDAGAGKGMAIHTAKSCIKVEPADDAGMVVKLEVESSYKLLPVVPSVEQPQHEIGETHDKIAESNEMGGAANPKKIKLD